MRRGRHGHGAGHKPRPTLAGTSDGTEPAAGDGSAPAVSGDGSAPFGSDEEARAGVGRRARRWLMSAAVWAVLTPVLFYLRFGAVPAFGWGTTVFLVALCLLVALGFYFAPRTEYHTAVAPGGGWGDSAGGFWLVACALGPFFGWVLTSAVPLTAGDWRWLYWGRVLFSAGLPVLTALPLLRYARGRGAPLMLAILLCVTALPCWSAWWTVRDLLDGPSKLLVRSPGLAPEEEYTRLPHTNRVLDAR